MNTTIPPEIKTQLSTILQTASEQIPDLTATIVDQKGDFIVSHNKGTKEPPIFFLASCIKLIIAIATMQLWEQGKLELDDEDIVEKLCPELKELKVLDGVDEEGRAKFVKKKKVITVRMLLSHTGKLARSSVHGRRRSVEKPDSQIITYIDKFLARKVRRMVRTSSISISK